MGFKHISEQEEQDLYEPVKDIDSLEELSANGYQCIEGVCFLTFSAAAVVLGGRNNQRLKQEALRRYVQEGKIIQRYRDGSVLQMPKGEFAPSGIFSLSEVQSLRKEVGSPEERTEYFDLMMMALNVGDNADVMLIECGSNAEHPKPVKGNPSTMDEWIKWIVKNEENSQTSEPQRWGLQAELIERSAEFGYKNDSAVKKSWGRLGLKSQKNTKST